MSCRVPGAPSKHRNLTLKIFIFEILRGPRGVKIGLQRPLGPFLERLGLLDASWSGLGGIFERSWTALGPEKRSLERLLAAPRGFPRQVSAILRAKKLPKRSPGGPKVSPGGDSSRKERNHKTLKKSHEIPWFLRAQGLLFEVQTRPKGSESQHRR